MTKSDNISLYKTAYCDSKLVLEQAWNAGLPRDARILTSSPALLTLVKAEPIHQRFNADQRARLNDTTFDFTKEIFDVLIKHKSLQAYAALIARLGIQYQSIIAHAATLRKDDFDEPRAILNSRVGHEFTNRLFRTPWNDLFIGIPNTSSFTFDIPTNEFFNVQGGTAPHVLTRLYQAGWEKLLYRMFLKLGKYLTNKSNGKRAFIFSENELLVETGAWLGLFGFSLQKLDVSSPKLPGTPAENTWKIEADLREILIPVIKRHVKHWVDERFINNTIEIFLNKGISECAISTSYVNSWSETFEKNSIGKRDVILLNYPSGGIIHALNTVSREKKIPVVAFEHGVTRQICETHKHMAVGFENNHVSYVMAFNTLSANISNSTPFTKGLSVPVGLPKEYFQHTKNTYNPDKPPILFVSTTLYIGNHQSLSGSLTDIEAANREIEIIEKVLNNIPHNVAYKPYPSARYADPDPIHIAAQSSKNIEFFSDGFDLRYEIRKYRIIVTSRATSTVSWCLMSGRPLVFIDYPDHMPLTDPARDAFKSGVFLIEVKNELWLDELKNLLSRPLEDIELEWGMKSEARNALTRDFFTFPNPGAGRRAANHIQTILSTGSAAENTY